ncbi:MAG: efflux RND transporter permease subunit [Anaerolineales bacterium]|nr:efflux RND transporter permease subunit [Anaerolineales bacterium]
MRAVFNRITQLSLRFRWLTVAVTVGLISLGFYSYTQLNQELIPDIEFPQTIVLAQNGGATSDQILHMYSIPIEEGSQEVNGVVNVESSSSEGLSLLIIRNEFGLVQSDIVDDIQGKIDQIDLPVRTLVPPDGMDAQDLLGELTAEQLAWLYQYSITEKLGFAQQLDREVWESFADDALSGFPESAFANLETDLKNELLAKRPAEAVAAPELPPALPASWSEGDARFATVEDIAELASSRTLAGVFNDFYADGHVVGPLVYVDDLTQADFNLFLATENQCIDFRTRSNTPPPADGSNPCLFLADLDAENILALPTEWLPENYQVQLSTRDRNTLAQVFLARELTGETIQRSQHVDLPDSWQVESPQLLTFNISDFPLGAITISSNVLTKEELRDYVQNDLVPRLRDLDNVANVTVAGGEIIPAWALNPELIKLGLDPIAVVGEDNVAPDAIVNGDTENGAEQPNTDSDNDIPQLDAQWQAVADGFGVGEFDSADDILNSTVTIPSSGEELTGIAIINWLAGYELAKSIVADHLPADVILWMAEQDPTVWENISPETLNLLPDEVVTQFPSEVQARRACTLELATPETTPPALDPSWQALATALGVEKLDTAADLVAFNLAGCQSPSAFLNTLAGLSQSQALVATLSSDILAYLAEVEGDFYTHLSPATVNSLAWAVVNELPDELKSAYNPPLGEAWAQLSSQPEMATAGLSLATVQDLIALDGSTAESLTSIVTILRAGKFQAVGDFCGLASQGYCEFAALLVNDLSPNTLEVLITDEPSLFSTLAEDEAGQTVLTYLSREALNTPSVSAFVDDLEDSELKTVLAEIRSGERLTVAENLRAEQSDVPEADPDAPALPSSWPPIGGFIGATLEHADDIINTRYLPDYTSGADFINSLATDASGRGQPRVSDLTLDVWLYLGENEQGFWNELGASALQLIADEVVPGLPQEVQDRIASGGARFEPEDLVTRTDGNASLVISIYKDKDANTVAAWDEVEGVLDDIPDTVKLYVPFEQSTYIEESLTGVQREGTTGAIMAIIVILIFMNLSVRSTLVTSVSIPASVMTAFFLMEFVPSNVYALLNPILEDVGRDSTLGQLLVVVIRLFPKSYTLNIMTLSGLTVAIGRVVDDSIVVLENIYRNIQKGEDQKTAILQGTREVSVAIFAATLTTMVVFLPLGLFGGVVGAFFLPFGLAVTYSLVGSYAVAITTVPVLAYFLINKDTIPTEGTIPITPAMGPTAKRINQTKNIFIVSVDKLSEWYSVAIKWVLRHRIITIGIATASLVFGGYLLSTRPTQFLPSFGDPTINISVSLPAETTDGQPITIGYTEARVRQLETYLQEQDGVQSVLTSIGGDTQSIDFGPSNIVETRAAIRVGMESQEAIDNLLVDLRTKAEEIFGKDAVQVSGAAATGGFGGFALELSGPEGITLADLAQFNPLVVETLEGIDGLANVESTLGSSGSSADTTYIRIDSIPAIRYTAELETDDSLGLTRTAIEEVEKAVNDYREANGISAEISVGEGFESQQQTEGFAQIFISMGIATLIVYLLLALTFGHVIHPITILVSLPLSVVGAAVALTVSGRALGLSALIGLLMLIGIVVTNAVVLLDRVQQNRREQNMSTYDALVEAGRVRLRPILMTAISTMSGVLPLALGFSEGAIIAAELGTVVIGGLVSSTFLTLLVVPVVYSLFDTGIQWTRRMVGLA